MIVKRPKTHKSPKYLPPAPSSPDSPTHSCGAQAPSPPFDVPWRCTREPNHVELEGEKSNHAAHSDVGAFGAGEEYDVNRPLMVARWPVGGVS